LVCRPGLSFAVLCELAQLGPGVAGGLLAYRSTLRSTVTLQRAEDFHPAALRKIISQVPFMDVQIRRPAPAHLEDNEWDSSLSARASLLRSPMRPRSTYMNRHWARLILPPSRGRSSRARLPDQRQPRGQNGPDAVALVAQQRYHDQTRSLPKNTSRTESHRVHLRFATDTGTAHEMEVIGGVKDCKYHQSA